MTDPRIRSMVWVYGMQQAMLCTLPYDDLRQLLGDAAIDEYVEFPALAQGVGSPSNDLADAQPVLFSVLKSMVLTFSNVWQPEGAA